MNIFKKFNSEEKKMLSNEVGIIIKDREYSKDELRRFETEINDFIFSHSSKNGDILKFANKYDDILNKFII